MASNANGTPTSPGVESGADGKLLCSFVPSIMLAAFEKGGAAIQPPTTHKVDSAVALFAVSVNRCACCALLLTVCPSPPRTFLASPP